MNEQGYGCAVKIVLTGGPCGGKSTGIAVLEQALTDRGYKVIVHSEMATNTINSGITHDLVGGRAFQKLLLEQQIQRDEAYNKVISQINKPVVIIYDRGLLDGLGYMEEKEFMSIVDELGLSLSDVRDCYDGVFNIVTAADGAREFYTLENNKARSETPEQAIEADRKLQKAWTGHPHLRIIGNVVNGKQISFDEKIDNLKREVFTLMGIPVPLEIERKYLIKYPSINSLIDKYKATKVEIVQTYLKSNSDGIERRVRQRGIDGDYSYYYTEKIAVTGVTREEKERRISQREYIKLLTEADNTLHQIIKERYCFLFEGKYFELDIYPAWSDKAILEIELASENETFNIPDCIEIIKEVTEDKRYKNRSLAESFDIGSAEVESRGNGKN